MKYILPAFIATLVILNLSAQTSSDDWAKSFEPQKVFIENRGQWDGMNNVPGSVILFSSDYSHFQILFTKGGLTYRLSETTFPDKEEREEREREMKERMREGKVMTHAEMEKEENRVTTEIDFVQMQWENSNPNVEVIATNSVSHYYTYSINGKNLDYVNAYEKLLYKNLYPGIDVEYVFHPKGGIEYSFILHPGADASVIKMKYSDVSKITFDAKRNLRYATKFGDIIEHAPFTTYSHSANASISSQFIRDGKTISFSLGSYDKSQTVIIDPWVQSPTFATQWDCVWECEKDGAGNAYMIGGVMPEQLLKYNAAGALQWTYSTPYDTANFWLGTIATDNPGNTYVTGGSLAAIQKISTAGGLIWDNPNPGGIFGLTEFWTISFNCDESKLVIGGTGGPVFPPQPLPYIYQVDMNSGNVNSSVQITGSVLFNDQEIRSITACGNGKYYFLTHDSIGYINQNFGLCATPQQAKQYFDNTYSLGYKCENFRVNNTGIEAVKTYGGFVYVNRGNRLDKRNFTTGAIIASATIPGGAFSTQFGSSYNENSGIDIDVCGNIYVGSKNQVVKYDQNLTQLATYPTTYNVYDVEVSTGGNIIVCGSTLNASSGARSGYIQQIAAGACGIVAITCCDASICQMGPYCTTDGPVTLTASTLGGTWSGTGITNSATGVFNPATAGQGTHFIKYTLSCGSDSIAIEVRICATLSACREQNGDITASGGAGPYSWYESDTTQNCSGCLFGCNFPPGCATTTYSWTQFSTGATITPPELPVRVNDVNNNELVITNTGSLPACAACALTASASSTSATCGNNNGSATATASGATPTGYIWSNGATTATATNLAAGTYTVTITSTGCNAIASVTVNTSNAVALTPNSTTASCGASNGSASVNATGGNGTFTYLWSNGGSTSTISNVGAGTYTVTVTSNSCTATASIVVSASNAVTASTSSVNSGCAGNGSATVSPGGGTGSFTYLWSNGGTTATISNVAAGTYTVTVTSGTCTATASAVVSSTGSVSASASTTNAGCTSTGSATVSPTGGTGSFTYLWNNGGTTATISNLSGGTYTVTVTSGTCTATASASVISTGGVTLSMSSTNTTCGNNNGAASVSTTTGTGPFTYLWSNGVIVSSIINVPAGIYTVTVNDAGGCSATAIANVDSSIVNPAVITSDKLIMCSGDSANICVVGSNYIAYLWNTGQITQCIYTKLAGNYYVTVTEVSNCTAASNRLSINVYALPPVSISVNGDTLTAYDAVTYQWFLNNSPIPGATSNIYIAQQTGDYSVAVTDTNGCLATSTKVGVIVSGIRGLNNESGIKIYPNPLESGMWNLEVGESLVGSEVEIFDAEGRLVFKSEIRSPKSEINLTVASGIYMLRLRSNEANVTRKLIKL